MDILKYSEIDLEDTIKRSEQDVNNVLGTVSEILENVRVNHDQAVREYTEKFDGVLIENLKVSKDEIEEAYDTLDDELLDALKNAADNIERFHKRQIPPDCKANQLSRMLHTRWASGIPFINIDDRYPCKDCRSSQGCVCDSTSKGWQNFRCNFGCGRHCRCR